MVGKTVIDISKLGHWLLSRRRANVGRHWQHESRRYTKSHTGHCLFVCPDHAAGQTHLWDLSAQEAARSSTCPFLWLIVWVWWVILLFILGTRFSLKKKTKMSFLKISSLLIDRQCSRRMVKCWETWMALIPMNRMRPVKSLSIKWFKQYSLYLAVFLTQLRISDFGRFHSPTRNWLRFLCKRLWLNNSKKVMAELQG